MKPNPTEADKPAGAVGQPDHLAQHVSETVEVIAAFQKAHDESASPLQRALDALTDGLGRPAVAAGVGLGVAAWVAAALAIGGRDAAEPAFAWLEFTATQVALIVALVILATQRRQSRLSERRAQLTLELAVLADRKTAKLVALMEEMRRDHPHLVDREDPESREMATPTDPVTVLAEIEARSGTGDDPRKS